MRRIYVERTGRMPPDDFKANNSNATRKRRPLVAIALVSVLCGSGGLVAANMYGSGLGSTPHVAENTGVSFQPVTNLVGTYSDVGTEAAEPHNARIAIENAVHAMHDM